MKGWRRILAFTVTLNCFGMGVAILLLTKLGGDPIGILCQGFQNILKLPYGHVSFLYNLVWICIALLVARGNIGLGSLVYAALTGYFIDLYLWLFSFGDFDQLNLILRLLLYIAGMLLLSFALSILIRFELGMSALEAVLYKMAEKTGASYILLRMLIDLTFVVVGYCLGGTFGIGTILCILFVGTLVKRFSSLQIGKRRYDFSL